MLNITPPVIERHERFDVARDDLLPGGTKSRYLSVLFEECSTVVYASPCQGAAQIALALKGADLGKRVVIFTPERRELHANTQLAMKHGAEIKQVRGMWNVVSARAREFAAVGNRTLAPFGLRLPEAIACLREACSAIFDRYDEIWCAAGSGTLAEALGGAFPEARIFAVSVGHKIAPGEAGRARVLVYDRPFPRPARVVPPFASNSTFDAKAWEWLVEWYQFKTTVPRVLFWNVDRDHG